jgi:hypothetical protein
MKVLDKNITALMLGVLLFTAAASIVNNHYIQHALAQTSSTPNFSVKGYTGNTFIVPSSIPLSNTSRGLVGSVIGGNWSFSVKGGTLQDFKWNAVAYTLSGKVNGTLSINGLSGATGAISEERTNPQQPISRGITLQNNMAAFKGTANIDVDGKPKWSNVPVVVYLLNGKLVNLTVDTTKTNILLPLFGIVTSLQRQ